MGSGVRVSMTSAHHLDDVLVREQFQALHLAHDRALAVDLPGVRVRVRVRVRMQGVTLTLTLILQINL